MRTFKVTHTRIVEEKVESYVTADSELDAISKTKQGLEIYDEPDLPGDILEEKDFEASLDWEPPKNIKRKYMQDIKEDEGDEDDNGMDGF